MIKTFQTFDDNSINSAQYKVIGHNFNTLPAARPVSIDEAQADSVDSGAWTVEPRANYLTIEIEDYPNRHALADQLRVWFKRGKSADLVATFKDDGLDYFLTVRVINLVEDPDHPLVFTVILQGGATAWRAVDADTDMSWSPTGAGGTHDITPGGTDETRLSVTLTPTVGPSGVYSYQNIAQLVNVPGVSFGMKTFYITLDTAALVAAGKMQDTCYDLSLVDNGVEIPRWITNPNTSQTIIAFNVFLSAGYALTLFGGVAQVETATAVHNITGSGNAAVTITAAGMTGSPKTINVAVLNGDTPAVWAGKVRAALRLDAAVTAMFTVSGSGATIVLIRKSPAANDGTLNIALANGTCTGITAAPTSVNTTTGSLYSVASSGDVTELAWAINAATQAALAKLSAQFIVMHGTEWFLCEKTATSLTTCKVAVLKRGALGTTKQQHNGGDVFYYIEHAMIVRYGNNSATDPSTATGYDNTKPVNSLADSDMTKAGYTATSLFYDPTLPNRPGSWSQFISRKGLNTKLYAIKGDAASGDPALGIKAAAYLLGASWTKDTVEIGWKLVDAGGIRRITLTGRKYRSNTFWVTAKLQYSKDGGHTWVDIFTETTPSGAAGFEDLASHTDIDIDSTSTMIRMLITGLSDKIDSSYALFEALTFIVYWTTANIPSLTLLGEQSNYHLDVRVKNTATLGNLTITDSVELRLPMRMNTPLVLDGENFEALYDELNMHGAITLDDESRTVWWRALPGVINTISIESLTGQDIGTLDVDLSTYRRRI